MGGKMAELKNTIVTNKGLELLHNTQFSANSLKFTKIEFGQGEYNSEDNLRDAKKLKDKKQEFPISSVTFDQKLTVKVTAIATNKDLKKAYYIREIGVYVKDPAGGDDILYAITIAKENAADYYPAYNGHYPLTFPVELYVAVSDGVSITIEENTGAYASADDLKRLVERFESYIQNNPRVMFGSADTEITNNTILFITNEEQAVGDFSGASYTNLHIGTEPPETGENWAQITETNTFAQTAHDRNIISGKLAVSEKEPADTAFFAKII